jgi:hypothetical protein
MWPKALALSGLERGTFLQKKLKCKTNTRRVALATTSQPTRKEKKARLTAAEPFSSCYYDVAPVT